ncbi:conjugal transfer protein TraD [Pasteurella multocida]|uniref:conjugal transfer protein TraD n=1 Tax=Pasteurella multocida TaxID=747 RepID=UPI0013F3B321|nr:conjugal transfer protein TraD [Pasteurella multocida]
MPNLISDLIGTDSSYKPEVDLEVIESKMSDANIPGVIVEFSPEEAEFLGAFRDDSMELSDIIAGSLDLGDIE